MGLGLTDMNLVRQRVAKDMAWQDELVRA